jgi:hypothetical protein
MNLKIGTIYLFNDAVISSDYMESIGRKISD